MRDFYRIGLCLWVLLSGFYVQAEVIDGIVAIVGTEVILKSEIEELKQQLSMPGMADALYGAEAPEEVTDADVLNMLIEDKLVEEAIREIGVQISEEEVESTINQIAKKNNAPKEQLIQMLKREGISYTQYKENIRSRLKKDRFRAQFITPYVTVTDEQVRRFMEREFPKTSLYDTTFVILSEDETAIWQSLKSQADRSKTMQSSSFKHTPTSYTGYFDEFAPEVAAALQGKMAGHITPVLALGNQNVVVRIDNIRKGDIEETPQYKEKFGRAKARLLQQAYKKYMEQWVKKRRFEVDIQLIDLPKN